MSAEASDMIKYTVLAEAPACVGRAVRWVDKLILGQLREQGIEAWIAGGAIRAKISQEPVKDVDLFFAGQAYFEQANTWMDSQGATKVYESATAVKWVHKGTRFDIVAVFGGSPAQTITGFDFTVCAAATDGRAFWHHPHFFADLAAKQLRIQSLPVPISTLKRLQRYAASGYRADNHALAKIAVAINALEVVNTEDFGPYVEG